jgi:hypothetical protein
MLKPGSLQGDSLEAGSMARAIEDAMVAQGVLKLDDETADAAELRRKTFVAIATGVINHLKSNVEIHFAIDALGPGIPTAAKTLQGSNGALT